MEKISAGASAGAISITVNDNVTAAGITTIDLSGDTDATGANVIDISTDITGSIITTLTGSAGSDTITGNSAAQTITGGAGDDVFVYGSAGQLFASNALIDSIAGGTGSDAIRLTATATLTIANTVSWSRATAVEKITVGANASAINILLNDNVTDAGITTIDLSGDTNATGANVIDISGDWLDSIITTLTGSAGDDTITGNNIAQTITGGGGVDNLAGKEGADTLSGGAGADVFLFDTVLDGLSYDVITDLSGEDFIWLDNAVFDALGSVGVLSEAAFTVGSAASSAEQRIIYDDVTGNLYYDADGSGIGAQIQFAQTTAGLTDLTSAQFVVI